MPLHINIAAHAKARRVYSICGVYNVPRVWRGVKYIYKTRAATRIGHGAINDTKLFLITFKKTYKRASINSPSARYKPVVWDNNLPAHSLLSRTAAQTFQERQKSNKLAVMPLIWETIYFAPGENLSSLTSKNTHVYILIVLHRREYTLEDK